MEFFRGQFDYICFFYGLAFFFVGIICFSIRKDSRRRLPWVMLGLFGFTHGINEWMDVYAISYVESYFVSLVHLTILGLSYVFLFEFARAGFLRAGKKIVGAWIYPLILIPAFYGMRYGLDGLNAGFRYFIGFPACIFSGFVIFRAPGKDPSGRRPLIMLGVIMAIYGIFTGLVVPKSILGPSQWLNTESFYQAVGLPVQFVRGTLALLAAMALWFYPTALTNVKSLPRRYFFPFKPSKWTILLTLVVLMALGWAFTDYLDYYAGIQLIKNSKADANSPLNRMIGELTKLEDAAVLISKSSAIRSLLDTRSPQDMERAASLIEDYKHKYAGIDCFLLDEKGMPVVSAGGNLSENIVSKSFASASYFKDAMKGKTGYYFRPGSTYDERVYYISLPVKGAADKPLGAIVIRKNITVTPILRYRLMSIYITTFVCLLAIIFFIALRRRENLIKLIEEVNAELNVIDTMKTDFVSIASHELRTPLTSIKNAASILSKNRPDNRISGEKEKELLDIIINNANRQMRMIDDLLDVSKIEAGVMDMYLGPVDIVALAKETVNSLKHHTEEKKIKMDVSSDRESLVIRADPEQTRRIFTNLIVNAIKFTPDNGGINVRVEEAGAEVRISVADTGIGISEEDQEKIFEKFYRGSDIRARRKGGSGLGLVITKGLVEAQGGRIWVKSKLNKGSTFYFTLPLGQGQKGAGDERANTDNRG